MVIIRGRVKYTQASKNPFTSMDQNRKDRINSTAITVSGGRSLICPSGKYDFLFNLPHQYVLACYLPGTGQSSGNDSLSTNLEGGGYPTDDDVWHSDVIRSSLFETLG